ncbi:MAG: hypothetical protein HZB70_02810 [Candidatus Berkelbacteria bacterium]|nr:MAG: hypothetical protein HZB70_02810 [Candidatus Berkelbacteria bacterium]QQG51764.1 MAG: hypothetical protein HY845_00185 [Candidatus Berkelbacteria bacterium]
MDFKKRAPLFIGIGLPVLMVLVVWASISLPKLFVDAPQHNFIYSVDVGSYYGGSSVYYAVENNQLVSHPVPKYASDASQPTMPPPTLYLHDLATNQSEELSLADAQKYKLSSGPKSADGFEVVPGSYGGGFPLFYDGGSGPKYFLKKGSYTKEIAVQQSGSYYTPYSFHFLGWIE